MKFVKNQDGDFVLKTENVVQEMRRIAPLSTAFIVDVPHMKESIKKNTKNFLKTRSFALAPVMGVATGVDSQGVFWNTFLTYIFPWMLDIAKVYCLVRIAQAFYQEKRGGRDSGTGFQALLEHGKWYLIFWLLPIGVELIDQVGHRMFTDMHDKAIIPATNR
jgi:hypothetical protein